MIIRVDGVHVPSRQRVSITLQAENADDAAERCAARGVRYEKIVQLVLDSEAPLAFEMVSLLPNEGRPEFGRTAVRFALGGGVFVVRPDGTPVWNATYWARDDREPTEWAWKAINFISSVEISSVVFPGDHRHDFADHPRVEHATRRIQAVNLRGGLRDRTGSANAIRVCLDSRAFLVGPDGAVHPCPGFDLWTHSSRDVSGFMWNLISPFSCAVVRPVGGEPISWI